MLLDTSGLLCYFDQSDIRQKDAVEHFKAASTCGRKSLTRRTCSLTRSTNSNRQGCLFYRWVKNFYPRVLACG